MDIFTIIVMIFVVLFAITIHEASHGWAAYKLGDPTAYAMGRVSLNPLVHIDPIGTILLPAIFILMGAKPIGWAKPVPVNPYNFRNPKRDNLIVSAAGPSSNFLAALVAGILFLFMKALVPPSLSPESGTFKLVESVFVILYNMIVINVILAIFNLIPIPPLDGSGIVMGLLSDENARKYEKIQPFGFIIVLLLLWTGILGAIFSVIIGIINFFIL